ncbi:MAG: HAMP domain-containing sensor histidine kinase [Psychrobacter sp.]|nr:HAMP domain-containing sensor histidine kinase [Psychrobacter sp.]
MINLGSITVKLRLSYLLFASILCSVFLAIFIIAEVHIEHALIQGRLIQQLSISQGQEGKKDIYNAAPGIKIYRFDKAPAMLQKQANDDLKSLSLNHDSDNVLYYFAYQQGQNRYILTYIEDPTLNARDYPVLAIFDHFEDITYQAMLAAIILSLLIGIVFSYLSARQITRPLLTLKHAVEHDHQNLSQLTRLPSEVGVLARTIDDKNRELAQYLKREQLFTGDVSHELRTPLTIIMGASEVLASQLPASDPRLEFTNRISNTAQETSEIITALLLLSRAPEQLDAPLTSINQIAHAEIERLSYLLRFKPVSCQLVAYLDYSTHVRPELLKMALGNLIKNAFQYTEEGEVIVTITEGYISVADSGIGIDEAMMPLLYERFERVEQVQGLTQNVEGSGLGLSIVQRIMTHLGWRLTHEANQRGGSIFTVYYRP